MQSDDLSFAASKLRDFVQGRVNENDSLHEHTGMVGSEDAELLSFLTETYRGEKDMPARLEDTEAYRAFTRTAATKQMGEAVSAGNSSLMSYVVGLTDSSVGIEDTHAFARMAKSILNEMAPYVGLMFGRMNYGKTSLALLYIELWRSLIEVKYGTDDGLVVTNVASLDAADRIVTDIEDFRYLIFGNSEYWNSNGEKGNPPVIDKDTPVFWLFDETSTHLDARTNSWEVANLYTPLVKRFAKANVDAMHIGHSGMDVHPELRRENISTEFIFKTSLKTADVFARMDDDAGADLKYELEEIPDTTLNFDPDDWSPWNWE